MTEGRDWTRVQFESCPDCDFDPSVVADRGIGAALVAAVDEWRVILLGTRPGLLRERSRPEVWSVLEYACHARDVIGVFAERIALVAGGGSTYLQWWDHQAAALEEDYVSQDPEVVAAEIRSASILLTGTLGSVKGEAWELAAERRSGERFTVRGMSRFVLHEVVHHRHDARNVLIRLGE